VTVGLPLSEPGGTVLDMTKAVLRYEIRKLSLAERLELVEELWDSIAAECGHEPFPLTAGQRADLERRLAKADADPASGAPWEEVLERIRQRPR
jgi:putative addiction module component (TIGR02574 family)